MNARIRHRPALRDSSAAQARSSGRQDASCSVGDMNRVLRVWLAASVAVLALAGPVDAFGGKQPPSQQPIVVKVSDGGFHWGDAGIGAAGALGLILVVAGLRLAHGSLVAGLPQAEKVRSEGGHTT
jgi:hypothetical protein